MASAKIATLVIRTIAKPISLRIRNQAREHERFREFCVNLAQRLHRSEVKLRTNLLGEAPRHIRPLSETRAIENGANFLAESFLFATAAAIIIGETWRSSRSQTKRRDTVDDTLQELSTRIVELHERVEGLEKRYGDDVQELKERNDELTRVLQRVIWIGMQGGWKDVQSQQWQQEFCSSNRNLVKNETGEPQVATEGDSASRLQTKSPP